jgi:hypothetical protein
VVLVVTAAKNGGDEPVIAEKGPKAPARSQFGFIGSTIVAVVDVGVLMNKL